MSRDATAQTAVYHLLQCAAGFYRSRDQALQAMAELRRVHALPEDRLALMAPWGAGWGSATWRAWQLSRRMAAASGVGTFNLAWAALAGGLCGGVLMTLWLVLSIAASSPDTLSWQGPLAWLLVAAASSAVCGVATALVLGGAKQPQRFGKDVGRQLAAGRWAVVVHSVPSSRQAGVVSLLQSGSIAWSAASLPLPFL